MYLTAQRIIIYDVKGLVPHRLEEEKLSNIYMFTYHESLNSLEREESSHARRRCRPAGSARRGRGLGFGLGLGLGLGSWWRASGPIRLFFLDQLNLNVLPFILRKNSMQFYLKRQVVCLENKNVMYFILSKVLNEIRESLEEEVSELNFPRSPRDSRPRAAAVAGSGSSPSL